MKVLRAFSLVLALLLTALAVLTPRSEAVLTLAKAAPASNAVYAEQTPVTPADSDFNYVVINGNAYIRKYNGAAASIRIPDTLGGKPVTRILAAAFRTNHTLTYIYIPSSVTQVFGGAFGFCDNLTTIDVDPANTALCSVNGVLYTKDMKMLISFPGARTGSFIIPDGVEKIDAYAFYYCYGLTKVTMYNSVRGIGQHAFSFCWSLASLRLSDCLEVIGTEAFLHCDALRSYHLPSSLIFIDIDALLGGVDSNSCRFYYFTEGLYCVKGSYAESYVKTLGVPYRTEPHTITDLNSGITLTDEKGVIPAGTDLTVTQAANNSVSPLFSDLKYSTLTAYDLSLTKDGNAVTPTGYFKLTFGAVPNGTVMTALKLYRCTSTKAYPLDKALTSATASTNVRNVGCFAILTSTDFSVKGDVDGDGRITLADARLVLANVAGIVVLTDAQKTAANVYEPTKGIINTDDARAVLQAAVGIKTL